ncbi:MAG: type VI secretion system contractile sheath large subunit [Pseudorhodobacter sp.]
MSGPVDTADAEEKRFRALAARIDRLICAIDLALTRQVNVILHMPAFQELEARWRALALLVDQAGVGQNVIVRVLDVSWPTLSRALERATDFEQSHLFRLVYDDEFGMPGGLPFGLLVADYMITREASREHGDQIEALRGLAGVGAAAFCPVIAGAAPDILGIERFEDLTPATDLTPPRIGAGATPADIRWNALRRAEDTRFVGLVAPRTCIRTAWSRFDDTRLDGFTFDEDLRPPLLVNGAFAFASTVVTAFLDSGWFAAIRGAYQDQPGGGRVPALGTFDMNLDAHALSAQAPVELRLTPSQEEAVIEQGVIPLSVLHMDASAVFNANSSLHAPMVYSSAIATQNARLSAMLQYVLCTSRFAHYLKVIMRDEIGSIAAPDILQTRLTEWLRDYCLGNDDANQDLKAQYPLRDAGVTVSAIAGKPGCYSCTIRLQPHFQLDDISTSFHLIAEAPPRVERIA